MFVFEKTAKTQTQFTKKIIMADIWAVDQKGNKRRFTETAWKMLGSNKEGFMLTPDFEIRNAIQTPKTFIEKPATGQTKTITIENALKKEVIDPVKIENSIVSNETKEVNSELKEDFFKAANGYKKGDIKDFFDKQDPQVAYRNNSSQTELLEQLGEFLKYDTIELQKAFN